MNNTSQSASAETMNWKESEEWLAYWKLISVDIDREIADEIEKYFVKTILKQQRLLVEEILMLPRFSSGLASYIEDVRIIKLAASRGITE